MAELKVSVEETSPVERKLAIEVPSPIVDEAFKAATRKVGSRAKVPGFRPGKIPPQVLEKMYGPQIADEVALEVVNKTYFDAVKEKEIKAIDMPRIDNTEPPERGAPFKYVATVEILPVVELKSYKGLKAEVEKSVVDEGAVDDTLNRLRDSRADLKEVEEAREIKADDYAIVDLSASQGGKPVPDLSSKGFTIPVGGGVIFPEIEEALKGMKVGDSKELAVTIPAEAQNKALAGKTYDFKIEVQGLKEKSLPELDDEFAKDVSDEVESLDELKAKIREDIEKQANEKQESQKREKALDALMEANPVEVPGGLASKETENMLHRTMHDFERQGINPGDLDMGRLFSQFRPAAERKIKTELLLDAVADKEGIKIDDAVREAFFKEEAEKRGMELDAVKRAYMQGGDIDDRLRLEKALRLVVAETKFKEVEPSKPEE